MPDGNSNSQQTEGAEGPTTGHGPSRVCPFLSGLWANSLWMIQKNKIKQNKINPADIAWVGSYWAFDNWSQQLERHVWSDPGVQD